MWGLGGWRRPGPFDGVYPDLPAPLTCPGRVTDRSAPDSHAQAGALKLQREIDREVSGTASVAHDPPEPVILFDPGHNAGELNGGTGRRPAERFGPGATCPAPHENQSKRTRQDTRPPVRKCVFSDHRSGQPRLFGFEQKPCRDQAAEIKDACAAASRRHPAVLRTAAAAIARTASPAPAAFDVLGVR